MSNTERKAQICLLNLQTQELPEIYNPYRLQNILKDSQNSQEIPARKKKSHKKIQHRNHSEMQERPKIPFNNKESLKKLLKKLQQMPSPQYKHRRPMKIKTQGINSKTEPLLQVKQCFRVCSEKREERQNKIEKNTLNEEEKIRRLIKRKVLMKRQSTSKVQKVGNFLKENHKLKPLSKRNSFYRKGQRSKKLINLLI